MRLLAALLLAAASPAIAQGTVPVPGGVLPSTAVNSALRPVAFAAAVPASGVVAIPAASMEALRTAVGSLPEAARAPVLAAAEAAKYDGKAGTTLSVWAPGPYARVLVVGADPALETSGRIAGELRDMDAPVAILAGGLDAAAVATGFQLGSYRFDRYKTDGKKVPPTAPLTVVTTEAGAEARFRRDGEALVAGVMLSRDLSAEPANVIYPESFVERVQAAFKGLPNVRISVLTEADMRRLNMGSFLGVGIGSVRPPRLLIVEVRGGGDAAPLALVGKGITFDSGGISLKPGLGMWAMKADMSGAASAIGAALTAAKRGAKANVVAAAALAENMPDGNAQRPGDVVRTMNGRTVEVLNTDAEGRLVLADANQYVIDRFRPAALVNIATLTGAARAALDDEFAAAFARDEALMTRVQAAATASGEAIWRLPLHANYAKDMKSEIADIKNVVEGGGPGAGLAAHFIQYLTPAATPWVHLDIAGVNWSSTGSPTAPKGATGWGVRLFDALIRGYER
ncbi:leucyl aminopeptidase family protein [Sandaracinobacteroides saxicola]|uniref:Probable cytosol aminopeptidase n=1 Tax=Sandaracinobacteroides saxicola TaxID=2759707 RepID=A0A7G5IF19_9SPHN|nr:M17 family peptidase N-terminal domain-containing protein [Sandaracinobacteroides saxicola]QMW21961.1 leucyl aminopeptidase [Sandaracinobacteroides saxicola]